MYVNLIWSVQNYDTVKPNYNPSQFILADNTPKH